MKNLIAIIDFDNNEGTHYVEEEKIKQATITDMLNADWSLDDCGLIGEGENEDGESIFSSHDFEGNKTLDEIKEEDIETSWYAISYWDGNNWQINIIEYYNTEEMTIEELENPSPLYYFQYELIKEDGEKIKVYQSNMSGHLSPYYIEENNE